MKKFLSVKKKKAVLIAIATGLCLGSFTQASAAELPSFFDWRLNNPTDPNSGADSLSIVSPVENQKYGTCWTFGSIGSYESSWMKQLKDAQAAGYNVTLDRNLFSKYYLAWTTFLPPVDNSNDPTPHRLMSANIQTNHPVYDIGGDVAKPTSGLLRYGAIDADALKQAQTAEEINSAAASLNTEANLNRLYQGEYAKRYMAVQYLNNELNGGKGLSDDEVERLMDEYMSSLTAEQVNSVVINSAAKDAVLETVTPKGILHDTYIVKDINGQYGLTAQQVADTKEMIQTEGTVMVIHAALNTQEDANVYFSSGEVNPFYPHPNHAESLVGWDDNYIFQNYTNADGSPVQGAFTMRNNWGTTLATTGTPMAKDGYGYLAYQDTSTAAIAFFNAGLDANRYTINQNNAPGVDVVDCIVTSVGAGTQAIANSYTAETDSGQFLKAVMFYASEKNMSYDITIREGETPGEGTILTQQSGTFGADGTPKWGGYRTVDLDNFVFLAKDKKYTVEVRTTSPEGNDVYIAQMAGQDVKMDGESYYYDEILKGWYKTDSFAQVDDDGKTKTISADGDIDPDSLPKGISNTFLDPSAYKQIYVFAVARNKESSSANGADFKVSWLDDTNSSGNSVINLGSASELYGTDYANLDRKTLSNMTVDLGVDVYNFYRGSIIGEGSVTKTGEGFLALNGTNTYTGGTTVNNGRLDVNGSIAGDATTTDKGVISGSGEIGGALKNNATAIAGNASGEGNLTVNSLGAVHKLSLHFRL